MTFTVVATPIAEIEEGLFEAAKKVQVNLLAEASKFFVNPRVTRDAWIELDGEGQPHVHVEFTCDGPNPERFPDEV